MKKILFSLIVVLATANLHSQTLNTGATWPDATWIITGTYHASNLLMNPTTSSDKFQFDDNQVANVGDNIQLVSPIIDLSAAFTAGEKGLKLAFDVAFALTAASAEIVGVQYWNADAAIWVLFPDGSASPGEFVGDYTACTGTIESTSHLDISSFTTNQLQNFRYRLIYNDGGLSQGKGICVSAPTLISLSCAAPTALTTPNIYDTGVEIGWTAISGESYWEVEYGAAGFTLGTGTLNNTDHNPHGISELEPGTSYDVYARADCSEGGGVLLSAWSSKVNFTTTSTLAIGEYTIEGFNLYPNPVSDKIELSYKEAILNVEVYNSLGQKVFSVNPNSNLANLNLATLKAGVYMLKVKIKDKEGSYKIIKK